MESWSSTLSQEFTLLIRCSHEHSKETVRYKIGELLERILYASQLTNTENANVAWTQQTFLRFDDGLLLENLRRIDWKHLCCEYDSHLRNQDSIPMSFTTARFPKNATTLDLILDSFENPNIWPCACAPALFVALWEVLCYSVNFNTAKASFVADVDFETPRSAHKLPLRHCTTPSQNRLMNHMTVHILRQNASMLRCSFWKEWSCNIFPYSIKTPRQGEIVLEMLRHWCSEFPSHRLLWLSLLSELIAALDESEDLQLQSPKTSDGCTEEVEMPKKLGNAKNNVVVSYRKRKRQTALFSFQCLHSELSDEQMERLAGRFTKSQRSIVPFSRSVNISEQEVWRHSVSSDGPGSKAEAVAAQLLQYWKIKAKCIQIMMLFSRRIVRSWAIQKPIPYRSDPIVEIFHQLLDTICKYPNSSTVRLCIVLLADICGTEEFRKELQVCCYDGYEMLLQLVWTRVTDAREINDLLVYVRYFSELIVSCSRYDDAELLFATICPFLSFLKSSFGTLTYDSVVTADYQIYLTKRIYLECFSVILECRGNMMLATALSCPPHQHQAKTLFLSLLRELSHDQPMTCYSEYFKSSSTLKGEFLVQALQNDGILRLNWSQRPECTKIIGELIPFPWVGGSCISLLETVAANLEPWLPVPWNITSTTKKMFSVFCRTNAIPPTCMNRLDSSRFCPIIETRCIMECLNDDLVVHIFSFLNYKRLVRTRSVCSSWNVIADSRSLWKSLYEYRYMPTRNEWQLVVDETQLVWKQIFINRWHAEREIRYLRCVNDPRWKVRLCNQINCLVVLKTPLMLHRHMNKHKRRLKKP
jgi:F-box-like